MNPIIITLLIVCQEEFFYFTNTYQALFCRVCKGILLQTSREGKERSGLMSAPFFLINFLPCKVLRSIRRSLTKHNHRHKVPVR